ncbi:MAG: AIR synthase-related protein [Thermodesulfobacteriota bacterium]|nr:AIR synthase-related protein [Thermodesulfobacteriota bacterium]
MTNRDKSTQEIRLPVGKLPLGILEGCLKKIPIGDKNVLVGPQIGEDAAVIAFGDQTLIFKTDPITFATNDIAKYLIAVNSNDIATMGGIPKYMLTTLLLPEATATNYLAEDILSGIIEACNEAEITLVGGHTEITYGIDRPITVGFMIGICPQGKIIKTSGSMPGDLILLSKGIPIEALAILAKEMPRPVIGGNIDEKIIQRAKDLIIDPGISVVKEASIALAQGGVTSMHDPTEGGLATGLLEVARASNCGLEVYMEKIPILDLAHMILPKFAIDPLGAIASGALIVCCKEQNAGKILDAWKAASISGAIIGRITKGPDLVLYREGKRTALPTFERDEIASLFS